MIQPEKYAYQEIFEVCICCIVLFSVCILAFIAAQPTPEPAVLPNITVIENVTEPTPTPTPEPTLSKEQYMETYGGMKQGEWLSWQRDNVSGLKDITTHVTVYDWRMFGIVHWYSVSWGQYFVAGASEQNKFLFVFVHSYSDDGSSTTWGIQPHQFAIDINGTVYMPSDKLLPEIRLKEFDEVWNLNHVENIKPYGGMRTYNSEGLPTWEAFGFLKSGKSQAWDGYIVFEVPKDTKPEDIKVIGTFAHLADSHWWQLE